jgi:hypothetical protein
MDVLLECLTARGDALLELADAVLCSDRPVRSLVLLSLEPKFRRGHGALYDALAAGRVDDERLFSLLTEVLPPLVDSPEAPAWTAGHDVIDRRMLDRALSGVRAADAARVRDACARWRRVRVAADATSYPPPDAWCSPGREHAHQPDRPRSPQAQPRPPARSTRLHSHPRTRRLTSRAKNPPGSAEHPFPPRLAGGVCQGQRPGEQGAHRSGTKGTTTGAAAHPRRRDHHRRHLEHDHQRAGPAHPGHLPADCRAHQYPARPARQAEDRPPKKMIEATTGKPLTSGDPVR